STVTAGFVWRWKLPIGLASDRACIAPGLATCWQPKREAVRMAVIPNTLELAELWVSPPLLEEARRRSDLEATGQLRPLPFDAAGDLEEGEVFPHRVGGRRHPTD